MFISFQIPPPSNWSAKCFVAVACFIAAFIYERNNVFGIESGSQRYEGKEDACRQELQLSLVWLLLAVKEDLLCLTRFSSRTQNFINGVNCRGSVISMPLAMRSLCHVPQHAWRWMICGSFPLLFCRNASIGEILGQCSSQTKKALVWEQQRSVYLGKLRCLGSSKFFLWHGIEVFFLFHELTSFWFRIQKSWNDSHRTTELVLF